MLMSGSTKVDKDRLAAVEAAIAADIEAEHYDGAALSVHVVSVVKQMEQMSI